MLLFIESTLNVTIYRICYLLFLELIQNMLLFIELTLNVTIFRIDTKYVTIYRIDTKC